MKTTSSITKRRIYCFCIAETRVFTTSIFRSLVTALTLSSLLAGCSNESEPPNGKVEVEIVKVEAPTNNLPVPDNRFSNDYKIIMFGNSHIIGLSHYITMLIEVGNPNADVKVFNAGGGFLDNSSMLQRRAKMLESEPWSHIILQGQKYSQSGIADYPTIAAQMWIGRSKVKGITPVLFPEHPQRGKSEEGRRVHDLHISIAAKQKSCVAPIGLTWDKVLMTMPNLILHNDDGNHASHMGSFLSALVFYEVITGESADLLPFIAELPFEESTQQLLGQIASEIIQANQPCTFE